MGVGTGTELHGVPELLDGFRKTARLQEGDAQVVYRSRIIRLQRDGPLKFRDPFRKVPRSRKCVAKIGAGLGVSGIEPHSLLQVLDRLRQSADGCQCGAQAVEGLRIFGP